MIVEWLKRVFASNLIFYNFFAPATALFYVYYFFRGASWRKILFLFFLFLVNVLIGVIQEIKWFDEINNHGYLFILIVAFGFVVKEFLHWLKVPPEKGLLKTPKFWLGSGILLFTACSLPIIAFANLMIVSGTAQKAYSNLLAIGNIILYLGYLMAVISTTRWIKYIG